MVDTKQNYDLRKKLSSISLRHRSCEQKKVIDVLNDRYSNTLTRSKENKEILKKIVDVQRVSLYIIFIIIIMEERESNMRSSCRYLASL